ncbi:MAG: GHMP kinase [Saprospiraceae bacterium]|nr:GHMP kinase [Saprospiraceae bacterium]MBL0024356.1 GHMP kinase [Saprospiraceae bacterium]
MVFKIQDIIKTKYYGHGKLLLTGEYAVLDGAKALGLPTKLGQRMVVKRTTSSDLLWESLDKNGKMWFESTISLFDFSAVTTTDQKISDYLQNLLKNAVRLNSEFLSQWNGFKIETQVEFPLDWGLGSSSTLIFLMSEWAEVNPLLLYFKTEDGSGFDVACAFADGPVEYLNSPDEVKYTEVDFNPKFKDNIFFVHLGVKKNSALGIKEYLKAVKNKSAFVKTISKITEDIQSTKSISEFESLLQKHEDTVASHTGFEKVKDLLFSDYSGIVKSLGAWGGDFVLATSIEGVEKVKEYFGNKGYQTVLTYKEIIL